MRATSDGYSIGRSYWRAAISLAPGALFIALLIGLLLGFGPVQHTPLFDVGVALAIAFFALGEVIIVVGFVQRPVLLTTSAAGILYYPMRDAPFFVPWAQIATIGVYERLVGSSVMRSLTLTLRPAPGASGLDAPDRISLPAHQLPTSAARCLRLLAERHREQIALNYIVVFAEPQMSLARV